MSHTTQFDPPPGWEKAVLIHDGYGMPGTVELRAWFSGHERSQNIIFVDPDVIFILREDGRVECPSSRSAPIPQQTSLEMELLYKAGVAVGAARLAAKVTAAVESGP